MKLKLFAIAAVLFLMFNLHAKAQAAPTGPPGQVCQNPSTLSSYFESINGFYTGITFTQSECVVIVSYLESAQTGSASMNRAAVAGCELEQASGSYEVPGVTNFGECVSYNEALLHEMFG